MCVLQYLLILTIVMALYDNIGVLTTKVVNSIVRIPIQD